MFNRIKWMSSQYHMPVAARPRHPPPIWVLSLTSSKLALQDVLRTTCGMINDPFHIEVVHKVLSAIKTHYYSHQSSKSATSLE